MSAPTIIIKGVQYFVKGQRVNSFYEQERTKLYDLRRRITEDKVKKDFCKKKTPKNVYMFTILSDFAFLTFLTFKMTMKSKFDLIRPTQFGGARDVHFLYGHFRCLSMKIFFRCLFMGVENFRCLFKIPASPNSMYCIVHFFRGKAKMLKILNSVSVQHPFLSSQRRNSKILCQLDIGFRRTAAPPAREREKCREGGTATAAATTKVKERVEDRV